MLTPTRGGRRGMGGFGRGEKLKVIPRQIVKKHTHRIVRPGRFAPLAKQPPATLTSIAAPPRAVSHR